MLSKAHREAGNFRRPRSRNKLIQSVAVATPGVEKRAALMFDKVFLIDFKHRPQALTTREQKPDWLLNRATVIPDHELSFINEQQEDKLFEAVGSVAEAVLAIQGK